MCEIVKYHNDIHTASLRKFNAKELDILMALMSRMRDKDEDIVTFTFDSLKKSVNWTDDNEAFVRMLDSTYKKLIECHVKIGNDREWTRFVLFTEYTISKDRAEISVSVYSKFKFILNFLTSNFTRFELDEFLSLKSSYAKEFYRRMKQFKNTGFWKVSLEEFKRVMDIPERYSVDAIDKRVLVPIKNELGKKYGLEIVKLYEKLGRGRPTVCGFTFTFLKENDLANDAETIDAKSKPLPARAEKQEPQKAQTPRTPKKTQKPDIELNENTYLMRTMKVRDKKFQQDNFLKILDIHYHPANGVDVRVKNMDDQYENTMHFDTVRLLDKFFNAHVIN